MYDEMRLTILQENNIAHITILKSFTNQIMWNVGFWWEGKTGVPGVKPLWAELSRNQQTQST